MKKNRAIQTSFSICSLSILLFMTGACQRSESSLISSPQQQLDEMDQRQPIPLVPMMANHQKESMRDHLVVVQEIMQALAVRDFAAIEKSAARIAYSEQQAQRCSHMGSGAPGFPETGVDFHRTADTIIAAAKSKDLDKTLSALSNTLAKCTACHSRFRQDVVSEKEWKGLTGIKELKGSGMKH